MTFEAEVMDFISRGNVLRYTLKCKDVTFTSEVLLVLAELLQLIITAKEANNKKVNIRFIVFSP